MKRAICAVRWLDRCMVVLCAVAMVGTLGGFELGTLTFRGFIGVLVIELSVGLFFGLVGLEGIVMTALHIWDEIGQLKKARRERRAKTKTATL